MSKENNQARLIIDNDTEENVEPKSRANNDSNNTREENTAHKENNQTSIIVDNCASHCQYPKSIANGDSNNVAKVNDALEENNRKSFNYEMKKLATRGVVILDHVAHDKALGKPHDKSLHVTCVSCSKY